MEEKESTEMITETSESDRAQEEHKKLLKNVALIAAESKKRDGMGRATIMISQGRYDEITAKNKEMTEFQKQMASIHDRVNQAKTMDIKRSILKKKSKKIKGGQQIEELDEPIGKIAIYLRKKMTL